MNTFDEPDKDAASGPDVERTLCVCRPDDLPRLAEALRVPPEALDHVTDVFAAALLLTTHASIRRVVLSLAGLYPQELVLIEVIKRHRPDTCVVVTDTAGRGAGLARATRLGADQLLSSDTLVPLRTHSTSPPAPQEPADADQPAPEEPNAPDHDTFLTPAELRALLGP